MDSARKMVVIPADAESATVPKVTYHPSIDNTPMSKEEKRRKERVGERLARLLKIILKVARVNGYDLEGRIRKNDGSLLPNSDIATLLNYAMTPGKVLIGESEFIDLLHKANVEPDLIINDNFRAKLMKMYEENRSTPQISSEPMIVSEALNTQPTSTPSQQDSNDRPPPTVTTRSQARKRRRPDETEIPVKSCWQ
jgi:hypothetical protein